MKAFQYLIILHPSEDQKKSGVGSKIVVPVQTVLATDQNAAILQAGRDIPQEYMEQLDRLEVAVRPF